MNLLLELVARYIDDRKTWYTFDASGPQFRKVCNKLVEYLEKDFSYVKKRTFWQDGRFWFEKTTYYKNLKHGLEIVDTKKDDPTPLYRCMYKFGEKHGLEFEYNTNNRNYLYYSCNWRHNKKNGTEIYYSEKFKAHLINWKKGLRHGKEIFYDQNGNIVEEKIWIKGKLVEND